MEIKHIKKYIEGIVNTLGLDELDDYDLEYELNSINDMFETELKSVLNDKVIHVIDVFGNEVGLAVKGYKVILDNIDKVIKIKQKYPDIPLEDALLKSDKRFCVVKGRLAKDDPDKYTRIIDVPKDIFKFLVNNEYDKSILYAIVSNTYKINYNYVDGFKGLLTAGKNFEDKRDLLSIDDIDLFTYIQSKYNPISASDLSNEFLNKYSDEQYNKLKQHCNKNNINIDTAVYRVVNLDMSIKDAMNIGEKERDKYSVGYSHLGPKAPHYFKRDILFKIIRERISEQKNT